MLELISQWRTRYVRPGAPSRRITLLAALGLAVSGLALIGPAQAGTTPPFDINGAVPDSGAQNFPDSSGNSQELGPLNASATKLGVIHTAQPPMLGTTNPNAQVDLRNIWLDTAKDSDGDSWLYIGWERDSSRGSGVIMYEFMQDRAPSACDYSDSTADLIANCNPWAHRKAGDFILVWDQVGSSVKIILRTWSEVNGKLVLSAGNELTSTGNAQAKVSTDGFFGEGAVNLTDTVFSNTTTQCLTYGNVIPGTVTGNSDTADYKDTVLSDVSSLVNISNCGSVKVTKVTLPAGGTGSFGYTLDRTNGRAVRFAADGYSGSELTSATGTLTSDGDSETIIDLIAGTNYDLDETFGQSTPYNKTAVVCTTEDDSTYALYSSNGGSTVSSFPVVAGETTECVITNTLQPGTLTVSKVLNNDDGGTRTVQSFSFTVNGGASTAFESDGSNQQSVTPGTYTVVESGLPIAGYTTTYANSVNSNADCTNLQVAPGGSVTCTITNDDKAGTLIVRKVVTNDNGGTASARDFAFRVNGGSAVTFESDGSNELTVDAGSYSVVEDALPIAGYATSYGNSVNSAGDCANLTVPLGGTVTCTITNNDTKASPSGATKQEWTLKDELTISGLRSGGSPQASVTFRLYSDASCSTLVGSEVDPTISAGVASTATGITVHDSGTYYWRVHYSGDSYNNEFTTACGDEVSQILAKDHDRDDFAAAD